MMWGKRSTYDMGRTEHPRHDHGVPPWNSGHRDSRAPDRRAPDRPPPTSPLPHQRASVLLALAAGRSKQINREWGISVRTCSCRVDEEDRVQMDNSTYQALVGSDETLVM